MSTEKDTNIKSDKLEITLARRGDNWTESAPTPSSSASPDLAPAPVKGVKPTCKYVNVTLCGVEAQEGLVGRQATLLLENPVGSFPLDAKNFLNEAKRLFGVRGSKVEVFQDAALKKPFSNDSKMADFSSKTLYLSGQSNSSKMPAEVTSPVCHFANVEDVGGKGKAEKGTLLLENPRGSTLTLAQLQDQVQAVFSLNGSKVTLSKTKDNKGAVTSQSVTDVLSLHSLTLYAIVN